MKTQLHKSHAACTKCCSQVWKSHVNAAKDPKVRKLYMLGIVARTRKQRLVKESVQDGFYNFQKNMLDYYFWQLRLDHLYRGYDDDYDPDKDGCDNLFTRSKKRKSSVKELLEDEGPRSMDSFKPNMAIISEQTDISQIGRRSRRPSVN